MVPESWKCGRNPKKDQHHLKVTPVPRRKEDNNTHQSDGGPSNGLWADSPPANPSQEKIWKITLQFSSITFQETPSLTQFKPKEAPDWPLNNTGTKP